MNVDIQLIIPGHASLKQIQSLIVDASLASTEIGAARTTSKLWTSQHPPKNMQVHVLSVMRLGLTAERFYIYEFENDSNACLSLYPYQAALRLPSSSATTISVHTHPSNEKDRRRIIEHVAREMNGFIVCSPQPPKKLR